jgi:hypothetical protein
MPPHDIATRAQALTLKLLGVSNQDIQRLTGIHPRTVHNIMDRAIERGLDLNNPTILEIHVRDGPRPGRPKKKREQLKEQLVEQSTAVEEREHRPLIALPSASRRRSNLISTPLVNAFTNVGVVILL